MNTTKCWIHGANNCQRCANDKGVETDNTDEMFEQYYSDRAGDY